MKKSILVVGLLVAALLVGCKQKPTEVSEASMNSSVKVTGHARYTVKDRDGNATDLEAVPDSTPVTVLRGIDTDGDATVDTWVVSGIVYTDKEGFFEHNVGVAAGDQVEVKANAAFILEEDSYAKDSEGNWTETVTHLFGEKAAAAALPAGKAVYLDLQLAADAYYSEAGLTQP